MSTPGPARPTLAAQLLAAILQRRRGVLVAAALAAVLLVPLVLGLRTDNSPEAFLLADHPQVARYNALRGEFGGDRLVRIGLVGKAPLGAADARWLRAAELAIGALPGAAQVLGPWSAAGRPEPRPPEPRSAPAIGGAAAGELDATWLRSPLARGAALVADEGRAAALLVTLAPTVRGSAAVGELVEDLRAALPPPPPGREVLLAGLPVLEQALDQSSREVLERFFPLLALLAALLLAVAFLPGRRDERDRRVGGWGHVLAGLAVPLVFVAWCELVAAALMAALGFEINLVLSILPPLLFVIALATAVHLVTRFRDLELALDAPPQVAVAATYADKGAAVVWTAASTLIGFGSLALSPVLPVRNLGILAALAIAAMALAALVLLPALLASVNRPPRGAHGRFEVGARTLGMRLAHGATRHRTAVLLATAGLAALALAGLPRLASESNALHYLATDHPVRLAHERLERLGMGGAAIELVLAAPAGTFADGRNLGRLTWLAELLREEPGVLGVLGVGELVESAVRASPAATSGPMLGIDAIRGQAFAALAAAPEAAAVVRSFVSADRGTARLVVFTATGGLAELDPVRSRLLTVAAGEFAEARVETSGIFLLLLDTQRALLGTLGRSAGVTLLLIAAVFAVLLRSLRLTLLALVPNVLPVLLVFGAMGWFALPLDLATVMVASTTLGLAVDDTLHTLVHYRELAPRLGPRAAVLAAVEANAAAYAITGLALAAGFGVCALSSFAPIARFGGLSAGAILLAVLADFLLVPALFAGGTRPPEG